jgi:hypothetical protein
MKKQIIFAVIFISSSILISCAKADRKTVDKMADEMCHAMSLIQEEDPMSILEAYSALTKIREKTDEYGKVTEEQLLMSMKEKCADGAEKYVRLVIDDDDQKEE